VISSVLVKQDMGREATKSIIPMLMICKMIARMMHTWGLLLMMMFRCWVDVRNAKLHAIHW
jgi:hypothetical protein